MSFQKAIEENLIFVCVNCQAERKGNEQKMCGHEYKDYVVKGGGRWKKEIENSKTPQPNGL